MAANDTDGHQPAKWRDFLLRPLDTWLVNPNNESVSEDSRYLAVTTMNCMLLNERQQPEDVIWGNKDPDIMDRKRTYLSPNISTFDAAWPHPRFICYSGEVNVTQLEFEEGRQGHSQVIEVTSLRPFEEPVVCDPRKALSLVIMPFLLIFALWRLRRSCFGRTGKTGARRSNIGFLPPNASRGAEIHDVKDKEPQKPAPRTKDQNKLQDRTTERKELQSEVHDLSLQLENARGQLSSANERTTSLESELINYQNTQANFQAEVDRLTTENKKLRHGLETEQIERSREREQPKYLNDDITYLAAENENSTRKLQETVVHAKEIIAEREAAHASKSEADKKADELRSLVQRAENVIIAANNRAAELEHDIRNVIETSDEDLATVLEQRNSARRAVDEQSHEECEKRLVEVQQQLSDVDAALENEKKEREKRQDELTRRVQAATNELEIEKRKSREATDDHRRELRDSEAALESMEQECEKTQDELEMIEGELQTVKKQLQTITVDLTNEKTNLSKVNIARTLLEKERDGLQVRIKAMIEQVNKAESDRLSQSELNKDFEKVKTERDALLKQVEDAAKVNKERDTSENQTNSSVEQLKASLASANSRIEELVEERDDAKDAYEQTEVQRQGLREELERLQMDGSHAAQAEKSSEDGTDDLFGDNDINTELRAELAEARKELEQSVPKTELEEVKKELDQANTSAATRIAALEEDVQKQKQLADHHVEENNRSKTKISALAEELRYAEELCQTQADRIEELEKKIAELEGQLKDTATLAVTPEMQVEERHIDELQDEVARLKEELETAHAKSVQATADLTATKKQVEELRQVQAEKEKIDAELEDTKDALKELRDHFDRDTAARDEEKKKLVAELEALKSAAIPVNKAMEDLKTCKQDRKSRDQTIEQLRYQLDVCKLDREKLAEAEKKALDAEETSKVHHETRQMQDDHIAKLSEMLKESRQKVDELETAHKVHDEELEEAKQQLQQKQELRETATNNMKKVEEANNELQTTVEKLDAELKSAHKKNDELQAARAANDSVEKVKQLENEIENLKVEKTQHDGELQDRVEQATTELQEKMDKEHKKILKEEKKKWAEVAEKKCTLEMDKEKEKWETKTTDDMEKMLNEEKETHAKKLEEEKKAWHERCSKEKEELLAQQKAETEERAQDDAKRFEEERRKLLEEAEKKLEEQKKEWHEQAEKKCAQEKKALLDEHNAKQEKKPEYLSRPQSSQKSTLASPQTSPTHFQNQETGTQKREPVENCDNCNEPMPKGRFKHLKTCKHKKIKDAGTKSNDFSAPSAPPSRTGSASSLYSSDSRPIIRLPPRQDSPPMSAAQRHGPPVTSNRPQKNRRTLHGSNGEELVNCSTCGLTFRQDWWKKHAPKHREACSLWAKHQNAEFLDGEHISPDRDHAVYQQSIDAGSPSRIGSAHGSPTGPVGAGRSQSAGLSPGFAPPGFGGPQLPMFEYQGQGAAPYALSPTGSARLFTASPQGMSPMSTGSSTGNMGQGFAAPPSLSDPGSIEPQSQPTWLAQGMEDQDDSTSAEHLSPLPGSQPTSPKPSDGGESSEINSIDAELFALAVSPTETSESGLGLDAEESVVPDEQTKETDNE